MLNKEDTRIQQTTRQILDWLRKAQVGHSATINEITVICTASAWGKDKALKVGGTYCGCPDSGDQILESLVSGKSRFREEIERAVRDFFLGQERSGRQKKNKILL